MRYVYLFTLLLFSTAASAQVFPSDTVDFEVFGLVPGQFLNGDDLSGGFDAEPLFLPNDYNTAFNSWSGWSISADTNTTMPGFMNQYSVISGAGNNGSTTYAVSFGQEVGFDVGEGPMVDAGYVAEEMYVNNTTYAFLSMRDGDRFAKRFGGVTGNDPDFFLLTVRGWWHDQPSTDSVDFYLADFRFENNEEDYIVDEWTRVDLSILGDVDSLSFRLISSDTNSFGNKTPNYFAIDDVFAEFRTSTRERIARDLFDVFPNPTSDIVRVRTTLEGELTATVFSAQGQALRRRVLPLGDRELRLGDLPRGTYFVRVSDGRRQQTRAVMLR